MNPPSRPHLFGLLAGLFLAAGLVFSAMVFTRAWMHVSDAQSINVTGSARRNIRADLIVWKGAFTTESSTLMSAQITLKADLVRVEVFLKSKGVNDYIVSPIGIQELHDKPEDETTARKTVGFRLSRSVEIRSGEVERIARLGSEAMELVEKGVTFVAAPPKYIYTKAGEAKVEMLAQAMKDARARAEQIASQGDRKIDQLRSARMGVFQITPIYSVATSWGGENDTTSLDKTITATVTASFILK